MRTRKRERAKGPRAPVLAWFTCFLDRPRSSEEPRRRSLYPPCRLMLAFLERSRNTRDCATMMGLTLTPTLEQPCRLILAFLARSRNTEIVRP